MSGHPTVTGAPAVVKSGDPDVDGITEQQRIQQQLHILQNSLPKVNELAYRYLLNEIIPLSVAIENNVQIDNDNDDQVLQHKEEKAVKALQNLEINVKSDLPSHLLCRQLIESDEQQQENVLKRLRAIGFQIGNKITELLVFTNSPNLNFKDMDLLAVMKFICRDVWKQMFGKQIDNLKTNHRGTFYLFDYDYRPIQSFALDAASSEKELEMVKPFLELPVGVIKGVLSSLGYSFDEVECVATFVDRPKDRPRAALHKGISFHVQVNVQ